MITPSHTVITRMAAPFLMDASSIDTFFNQLDKDCNEFRNQKVVLLYSGGLDTTFLVKYLSERVKAQVHTVSFNVGGNDGNEFSIAQQAKFAGAIEHHVIDCREQFADEYCTKALLALARYNGDQHPISSSLTRPLMIKESIDLAKRLGCAAIVTGSVLTQNNLPRFTNSFNSLDNNGIKLISPLANPTIPRNSRELQIAYLSKQGISIREGSEYSRDDNLWSGEVEDGENRNHASIHTDPFYLAPLLNSAPEQPIYLEIEFENGIPIKLVKSEEENKCTLCNLTGGRIRFLDIINHLNQIGSKYGVGWYDCLEDRPLIPIPNKEREIHFAPAPTILMSALRDLQLTTIPQDEIVLLDEYSRNWTRLVFEGKWFSLDKLYLEEKIGKFHENRVNGVVKLLVYPGGVKPIARNVGNKSLILPI